MSKGNGNQMSMFDVGRYEHTALALRAMVKALLRPTRANVAQVQAEVNKYATAWIVDARNELDGGAHDVNADRLIVAIARVARDALTPERGSWDDAGADVQEMLDRLGRQSDDPDLSPAPPDGDA